MLTWLERFLNEQITKTLQGDDFCRRNRLIAPGHFFQNEELGNGRYIVQIQRHIRLDCFYLRRPTVGGDNDVNLRPTLLSHAQRLATRRIRRPQQITSYSQLWLHRSLGSRRQQLLHGHMRRLAWASHTKFGPFHRANGGIGGKGQFDGVLAVRLEINLAGGTMGCGAHFVQVVAHPVRRTATHRAEQFPLKIEQAHTGSR